MKLPFTRKPATPERPTAAEPPRARTSAWTNGSVLGKKIVGVLLIIGWALPLAIAGVALLKASSKPAVTTESSGAPLTTLEQSAGAFSVGFVGAWLSSTKSDTSALSQYLTAIPAGLGDVAFDSRNLAVAEVSPQAGTDLVTVVVSADVYEKPTAENPPAWIRRWFEVVVRAENGQLTPLGLPAPKAGPQTVGMAQGLSCGVYVGRRDDPAHAHGLSDRPGKHEFLPHAGRLDRPHFSCPIPAADRRHDERGSEARRFSGRGLPPACSRPSRQRTGSTSPLAPAGGKSLTFRSTANPHQQSPVPQPRHRPVTRMKETSNEPHSEHPARRL